MKIELKKVKVVDKLLPDSLLDKLNTVLSGHSFPWFWNDFTVSDYNNNQPDNNFMFTHNVMKSDYFKDFETIGYFIGKHTPFLDIMRMKLNLYTNQNKRIEHAKHVDIIDEDTNKPGDNTTITLLNFTDCNGGTIIDGKEYPSKANQALIFDNKLYHQGIVQTDTPNRIILNIATYDRGPHHVHSI